MPAMIALAVDRLPSPGEGGGPGGPSGHDGSGGGGHDSVPRPPPGPGPPGGGQGPTVDHQVAQQAVAGRPRRIPAPAFSGTVADSYGAGNNQCGSSFYGPAYGGGVGHQGVGASGSQPNVVAGYPSSIGSASTLGPGLSLGYSVHGAGRQGDGGLLPEAMRGDDGWTSAPSVVLESPFPVPLSSHALAVE